LVLPATDVAAALKVAERAREAVSRVPVPELELRCSAGVACYPADASDATALSQVASGALSWAKRTGKSRTRRFDPKHATPGEISELAAGVRMTLSKEGAIATVFQPVVALATGSVVGYEALTRFPTTERSPHACFAEAHACGLGPELEGAAIRSALAPLGRPAGTHLALNVSPSALGGAAIREALPADLSELVIEITENEVADASDQLRGELRELRERGARIALDDAGAGYSGLKQLMSLRPDIVKLDRDLIAGIHDDPARLALVESFVRFAQQVEATVCAEGIESLDDLAAVADLDVHWGQGFALARPASEWPGVAPVAAQVCRTTLAEALRVAPSGAEPSAATGERQLERLSAQLADASSREDLESCLSLIAAGLHADAVSLSGWKADEGILETLAQRAGVEGDSRFALSDYPLTARVLETREAAQVLAGDPSADPNEVELLLFYGYRSLLLVPVVHGGRSLGVVEAYSRDERAWTRAQIILARIIANQLAPTIEALPPWEETQPDQRRRLGGAT
jgi:EAL domain-containing protein (putative c-di-GMP-specific phosphodiesterase class I)